jgi:ankyrin repeat protein
VILYTAAGNPSGATAKVLLQGGADPNAVDRDGQTALIKAAAGGYPDIAQILIRYGADVNARDGAGLTALMYAARGEHVDVVDELLRSGARTDLKNHRDESVMEIARKALERAGQQPPVLHRDEVIRRHRHHCEEIIRLLKAGGGAP